MAVLVTLLELKNWPVMADKLAPVVPPVSDVERRGTFQEKLIESGTMPFAPLEGDKAKGTPLQLVEVIALIDGTGFR